MNQKKIQKVVKNGQSKKHPPNSCLKCHKVHKVLQINQKRTDQVYRLTLPLPMPSSIHSGFLVVGNTQKLFAEI